MLDIQSPDLVGQQITLGLRKSQSFKPKVTERTKDESGLFSVTANIARLLWLAKTFIFRAMISALAFAPNMYTDRVPISPNGRIYAAAFVALLLFWPLFFSIDLAGSRTPPINLIGEICALIAIMGGSYALNFARCSSSTLSYWDSLVLFSGLFRTGIMQLTLLILFPLLFVIHVGLVLISLASLVFGKTVAEHALVCVCQPFVPVRIAPSTAISDGAVPQNSDVCQTTYICANFVVDGLNDHFQTHDEPSA